MAAPEEIFTSDRATETMESASNLIQTYLPDVDYNLSVGMPYWSPGPEQVKQAQAELEKFPDIHYYGDIEGNEDFLNVLRKKLETYNGLDMSSRNVMVTVGATQGFLNLCQALFDPNDEVILFAPFYFNQKMALQLLNITCVEVPLKLESTTEDIYDLDLLQKAITPKTRAVVLVNPHNPTGAVASDETVKAIEKICEDSNICLISDEAYETFYYGTNPKKHFSPSGPHTINLYSFSKCFGMCGWRCGYIVYPKNNPIESSLAKIQDSVVMHVPHGSQMMGKVALEKLGVNWCKENAKTLEENRNLVYDAIQALGPNQLVKTSGAIYMVAKLPHDIKDTTACSFLSKKYKVIAMPCTTLGAPGYLRVCFSFMKGDKMKRAASQLKKAFQELAQNPDLSEYEE